MFLCGLRSQQHERASHGRICLDNDDDDNNNNNNNNNSRIERRNSRFLQSPHWAPTVSNTYAQVVQAQSCANHAQHIERLSRAACSVPLGTKGVQGTAQLLSITEWKSHLFSFILLAETINR